ncbi:LytTR family transcriptional regulator DNA-binding domain-containing protein [Sagittula sp. NFXS13]|uniref:LytTR family DNA-binding domain-containing protein n=1 Tax=Sagittula sp. NFXS13 TaxID=2819095 RepID=UPI0032DF4BF9
MFIEQTGAAPDGSNRPEENAVPTNSTFPVVFIDVFGTRHSLDPIEFALKLVDRRTQIYLCFVLAILVFADPPGLIGQLAPPAFAIVWITFFGNFILTHISLLFGLAWVQRRTGTFAVFNPLMSIAIMAPTLALSEALVHVVTDGNLSIVSVQEVIVYLIVTEIFLTLYLRYIHEAAPKPSPVPEAPEPETPHRQILIGSEPVPLAGVCHIQAREHHVQVVMHGETMTHRVRLSDIVAQTDPEDGIQPHRSWWVAVHAAQALEKEGAKHVLRLSDGTRVPVARSRVDSVRDWLAAHA